MFSNLSAELSLNAPCKSVVAVTGDAVESRFLVGTCAIGGTSSSSHYDNDDDDGDNTATTNHASGTKNHLHVVRYHSDVNDVGVDASLIHPGPIQHMCCHPRDKTLVLTLGEDATRATLYKIPTAVMDMSNDLEVADDDTNMNIHANTNNDSHRASYGLDSYNDSARFSESSSVVSGSQPFALESKLTLETSTGRRMVDTAWRGTTAAEHDDSATTPGDVLTLDESGTVLQWDVALGMAETEKTMQATDDSSSLLSPVSCPRVVWDPHHGHSFAVSWGRNVQLMDSRTGNNSAVTSTIPNAHRYGITDVDYNPNKPHVLATAGHDGLIHFWDIRYNDHRYRHRRPLLSARGGHSHYAWRVQYNPFHDQLVLSTGTDAIVNLWRVSTISSAPLLTLEEDNFHHHNNNNSGPTNTHNGNTTSASETDAPNVRVAKHESGDAVYGAAWGAADAWLYATVAYDGKVALHHVPSKEKYKILL